ncbi:MAG: trypsin-like peptidase domain-containing protein [Lentisphaeria bacterium]|nr:trypsin-like peptidase domain-containing protein [Lentisphaeria bacterium]
MKYYIISGGKTYGPVEENKIRDKVRSGFFSENSLVSADLKEWQPLHREAALPENSAEQGESRTKLKLKLPPEEYEEEMDGAAQPLRLSEKDVILQEPPVRPLPVKRSVLLPVGIVLFLLLLLGGAGILFFRGNFNGLLKASPADFQEVCRQYQTAVGVITVTLEDVNGKLLNKIGDFKVSHEYPIGTAFAIGKNQFATNCHVAYGIKDQKTGVLENVLWSAVLEDARNSGAKNREQIARYCQKNKKQIEACRKLLHENVKVRSVEIRLAHSGGKFLKVTGVQIHPRYQANPAPDADSQFKNGEFDVAILTTSEHTEKFVKIASTKRLYALVPGQSIAYIGFPMEGLMDNGNLDLNRPEAVFKSGTINKITDFNKVYSMPEFNKSIIHDIPTTGGASGSPIFLPNGEVVAILWGGSFRRVSSAVQHNMAVRIDSLDLVRKEEKHDIQEWLGEEKK